MNPQPCILLRIHYCISKLCCNSVADPGFPRWENANAKSESTNLIRLFDQKFPKKPNENERNLTRKVDVINVMGNALRRVLFLKKIRSNLLCRGLIVKPRSASVEKVKTSWPRKHAQRNSSPYDSFVNFLQHFVRVKIRGAFDCLFPQNRHSLHFNQSL